VGRVGFIGPHSVSPVGFILRRHPELALGVRDLLLPLPLFLPSPFPPSQISNPKFQISAAVAFLVAGCPMRRNCARGLSSPHLIPSSPQTTLRSLSGTLPFPPSQISNLKFQISAAVALLVVFAFAFAFSPHPPQNPVQDPSQRRNCFANTSGVTIPQNGDDDSREFSGKREGWATGPESCYSRPRIFVTSLDVRRNTYDAPPDLTPNECCAKLASHFDWVRNPRTVAQNSR
jgi:hypothetical protein